MRVYFLNLEVKGSTIVLCHISVASDYSTIVAHYVDIITALRNELDDSGNIYSPSLLHSLALHPKE